MRYWTFERCKNEALKHESRSSFRSKARGAASSAIKNGWYEEVCSHMKVKGSVYKRMVYAYEFKDNSVYVGLTCNLVRRNKQHLRDKSSAVFKHISKTNSNYTLIELTDIVDVETAKSKEAFYLKKYKDNGWFILNVAKSGGIGAHKAFWTYEKCKKIALTCNHKKDLFSKYGGCYSAAKRNGWLKDICSHMKPLGRKPKWKFESVHKEALKYTARCDFKRESSSAYNAAVRNGWLVNVCKHMTPPRSGLLKWTFSSCKALCENGNYRTRAEFRVENEGAYNVIMKNGWGDALLPKRAIRSKWTYDECKEKSKAFKSKHGFKKGDSGAYQAALKNKWLDDFFNTGSDVRRKEKGVEIYKNN